MNHFAPAAVAEPITVRIPDAVRVSGLSRAKLYKLMKAGELRTTKVGGSRLIPMNELRRLVGEAA